MNQEIERRKNKIKGGWLLNEGFKGSEEVNKKDPAVYNNLYLKNSYPCLGCVWPNFFCHKFFFEVFLQKNKISLNAKIIIV